GDEILETSGKININAFSDRMTIRGMDARWVVDQSASMGGSGFRFPEAPERLPGWPASATTDDQGRFVLRGIGRGQPVGLLVRDERYALQVLDVDAQARAGELLRVLAPPRPLPPAAARRGLLHPPRRRPSGRTVPRTHEVRRLAQGGGRPPAGHHPLDPRRAGARQGR